MLYAIHRDGAGRAVGVWNENGGHYYAPDKGFFEARGKLEQADRPPHLSWDEHVQELSHSSNPHSNWSGEDYPEDDLPTILGTASARTRQVDPPDAPEEQPAQ